LALLVLLRYWFLVEQAEVDLLLVPPTQVAVVEVVDIFMIPLHTYHQVL
jgi:hypothetical protein